MWVTHLLGTGHLFRTAAIARALDARGARVTVVSGGLGDHGIDFGGAEVKQLLGVRARDATFHELLDEHGDLVAGDLLQARGDRLMEMFREIDPEVFVTELYPFGRRKFRRELDPVLKTIRKTGGGTVVVSSVRDILEPPGSREKSEDAATKGADFYDMVLVHGDMALARLEDSFPWPEALSERLHYTGYINSAREPADSDNLTDGTDEILVSAGGGAVGMPLYRSAIEASRTAMMAGQKWRLLVGHNLAEEAFQDLKDSARQTPVLVERARPDFPEMLRRARVSVSQAGYNTVVDILAAGTPSVLVPFAEGGEQEQTIRARLLAQQGRAVVLSEGEVTPDALGNAIKTAMELRTNEIAPVAQNGAEESARLILRAAERASRREC